MSQNYNEFELHLRAILGIPIPNIKTTNPGASQVISSPRDLSEIKYKGFDKILSKPNNSLLLFGKENATKGRRMGVVLSTGKTTEEAREECHLAVKNITLE